MARSAIAPQSRLLATVWATLRAAWLFALLGIYVGVVPVALGLLWYPLVGRMGPRALDFLLALTLGLLLFLLVDALHETREIADALPGVFQGAALSVLGILVTAIFILTIIQRVFAGPLNEKWSKLPDLTLRERVLVGIPIALMFVLGLYPRLVLDVINSTAVRMVEQLKF